MGLGSRWFILLVVAIVVITVVLLVNANREHGHLLHINIGSGVFSGFIHLGGDVCLDL